MANNPYVGKITHNGAQTVKVNANKGKSGNSKVKTGTDLRTGRK